MSADQLNRDLPAFVRPTQSPVNLAVVRIIGCSAALLYSRPDRLVARATLDAPRIAPTLSGDLLLSLPRSNAVVTIAAIGLTVALVGGLVGWHTRWTLGAASLLSWYVVGLTQSFGKVDHTHHLLWVLVILAASPCADALSIDARGKTRPADHPAYGFPVRAIWLVIGLAYFSAGLWKIGSIGLDWVFSDNLRNIMWDERLARGGYEPLWDVAGSPLLYRSGAALALLFELTFLFLVLTRARPVVVGAGFLFHMSTWATMGISFMPLVVLYGIFFDWTHVAARFGRAWQRLRQSRPSPGMHSPPRPRTSPLGLTVPLALIVLVAMAGATRELNGWPVASYPDFGYRASDRQTMVSLRVESAPVRLTGLTAIEQHRLLNRALSSATALAELRSTVEQEDLCRSFSRDATVVLRVDRYAVTDSGLVGLNRPSELEVLRCGPSREHG